MSRLGRPILALALLFAACDSGPRAQPDADHPRAARLEALLSTLAADSMEGRRIGTAGAHRAARFLAAELERYGVEAAGDDGYFQRVPLAWVESGRGRRLALAADGLSFDTIPADRLVDTEANVVGIIRGSDPSVAGEAVVLGAHFDHVGIGPSVPANTVGGDTIYNGADDDGSGTVAVLEIARELVEGTPPRRTVVILLSTGEESGLLGTRWYIEHPVVPLEQTVADLQIEMIGRPDAEAGGFGRGWLTGYERTTMGDQLAASGSPIVPDPRPDQQFFYRSDNIAFARLGIPAHTLSSFNLHLDYHQPSDEVDKVDFAHMAALVTAAVQAVRFLADGPRPEWKENGQVGLTGELTLLYEIDPELVLGREDFEAARARVRPYVHHTPLLTSRSLSEATGFDVRLKAELFQKGGSYKVRGPTNLIGLLTDEERARGVICSSAGNHSQGVAIAARQYGVDAVVCMAANATPSKIAATEGYGAEVVLHGSIWDEANEKALQIMEERGLTYVHPFDDPRLIAGQGTVGLEIMEDWAEAEVIVVPIGGGGLISGVSMAVKAINPGARVIGVESSGAPAMKRSVEAGRRVTLDQVDCIIDGLRVKRVGENTHAVVTRFVDEIVTLPDEQIFDAVLWLMSRAKLVTEGAAAAPVAALLQGLVDVPPGTRVVAILSGGNLDVEQLRGLRWN